MFVIGVFFFVCVLTSYCVNEVLLLVILISENLEIYLPRRDSFIANLMLIFCSKRKNYIAKCSRM